MTFLRLFLVPKSILFFCKIEQKSNKTKMLKTLLCRQYLTDFIDLKLQQMEIILSLIIGTLMESIKSSLLQILHKTSRQLRGIFQIKIILR